MLNQHNKLTVGITGVSGFLGSNIARRLVERGIVVYGLIRETSSLERLRELTGNPLLQLKLEPEFMDALSECDVVIHTATCYGRSGEPFQVIEDTNFHLPCRIVQKITAWGGRVFINADTFMPSETPQTDKYYQYVQTKKKFLNYIYSEQYNALTFVNMVIYHMYGPNDNTGKFLPTMIQRLLANEPHIALTLGDQTRDFIYVSDVVDAFEAVLNSIPHLPSKTQFYIGTGKEHTIRSALEWLVAAIQSKSHLEWGSVPYQTYELMRSVAPVELNAPLDWHSKVSLEEGLDLTLKYYRQSSHK